MRVLLAHNYYGSASPSGENKVFEDERLLLLAHGHDVKELTRHSDEIRNLGKLGKIKGALSTPWNPWSVRSIKQVILSFQPNIVHIHNTFPLLSPSIFSASRGTARVLTLHNYRIFCPSAIPVRDGQICTECIDRRSTWPALLHACYRNSRLATLPLAVSVDLHRLLGTWDRHVEAFIVLSDFQRELMIKAGLSKEKVYVKPNFFPGKPSVKSQHERGNYIVFVGRLSQEKGLHTLLKAWRTWGDSAPELRIIGEGPLYSSLVSEARGLKIKFLGQLSQDLAQLQISNANLLVLPSECYEGFPMVIREAFAFGTPVAVSNLGPLPIIVSHGLNGVVFDAFNSESLLSTVRSVWLSKDSLKMMSQRARKDFEDFYNEDANYQQLMQIYDCATSYKNRKK